MEIKGMIEAKIVDSGFSRTTGKPYTRYVFTIDGKKYSCFDAAIYEAHNVGQSVKMTGQEKGDFFNMSDMIADDGSGGVVGIGTEAPVEVVRPGNGAKNEKSSPKYEPTSMYVSYAKDIFVSLDPKKPDENLTERMNIAIELVKQAKTSFE